MKHIYIARHGLTDWNLIPKVQGMTDIPLNEGGLKQANALAQMIKDKNLHFDKILHSRCTDHTGHSKSLYASKDEAERMALLRGKSGIKLYVYKCPTHNGYHLTSSLGY